MAKTVTQNGVSFSTYKTSANEGMLPFSAGIVVSGAEGVDPNYGGVINAVDIDWNGAELQAKLNSMQSVDEGLQHPTIQTTGELIDEIVHLRAEVNTLTSLVKGLYAALSV